MAESSEKQNDSLYITSLASFLSGALARLICHPIDTIKAKIQVGTFRLNSSNLREHGIINTAKQTIKNEGWRGFYKGVGIASLGSAPAFCLYFSSYEIIKRLFDKTNIVQKQEIQYFLAGFGAEVVSCIFWVPIDVIKERMQVQSTIGFKYANSLDAAVKILNTEGIRGIYKGYGATLCSFGPFSALYFLFYEKLKYRFIPKDHDISLAESIFLSGLAGSGASFITNGLDMAKLRLQVQRAQYASNVANIQGNGLFGYKNVIHGVISIAKNEGFFSLFKGSLSRILFHTPSTAITMGLFEYFKKIVKEKLIKHD